MCKWPEICFVTVLTDYSFGVLQLCYEGKGLPEYLKDREYGSGMVASFTRKKGEVFCAGSCEWVSGLIHKDIFTMIITRNVLDKFTGRKRE